MRRIKERKSKKGLKKNKKKGKYKGTTGEKGASQDGFDGLNESAK